jgi:hypothetical protein
MSPKELCHNLLHKLLIRSRLDKRHQIYQFAVADPPTGPARSRSAEFGWIGADRAGLGDSADSNPLIHQSLMSLMVGWRGRGSRFDSQNGEESHLVVSAQPDCC